MCSSDLHRTLMYVGDEGIAFRTERTGILGVVTDTSGPTNDAADPVGWVRSRIRSAEDLALLNGRARVPVQFANVREHEARLLELAGTRVTVRGVWVGEKIRIEEIEPAAP